MIHFNTAGAGRVSSETLRLMQTYLQEEYANGAYETELSHAATLDGEVYESIARLLGAKPRNIALFEGATKAWVTALNALNWSCGARVVVTPYEYAGNLIALSELQRRHGVVIDVMPLLPNGDLDLQWLAQHMSAQVMLVSVVHVPSCCGIVNDVEAVGRILRDFPCFYFVDACQSVGMLPLDMLAIGADVLTAAGRKFLCGPRGTGFAYLSDGFLAVAQPRFTRLPTEVAVGYSQPRAMPNPALVRYSRLIAAEQSARSSSPSNTLTAKALVGAVITASSGHG